MRPAGLVHALVLLALIVVAPAWATTESDLQTVRDWQTQGLWAQSESLSTALVARLDQAPIADSLALAEALYRYSLSRYWHSSHTDTSGRQACARALAIRRRSLPPSSDRTTESALLGIRWVLDSGLGDSALVLSRALVRDRRPYVTPGDTLFPEAWRSVAVSLRDRGDRAGALAAYESTMVWSARASGEGRVFGSSLAEIGRLYGLLGQPDRARDTLLHALEIIRRSEGPDGFAATVPLDYLSTIERNTGRLTRAIDYSQAALKLARMRLSDNDYEVARIRRNMCSVLTTLGDYPGALALLAEVLPVYQKTFGPTHWRMAALLNSIGSARGGMLDSTGMAPLREAEAIYLARAGGPDPELARVLHAQAMIQYLFGQPAFSLAACERALALGVGAGNQNQIIVHGQLRFLRVLSLIDLRDSTALDSARTDMMRFATGNGLDSSSVSAELHTTNALALHALGRENEAWAAALDAERLERELTTELARSQGDELALIASARVSPRLDLLFEWARSQGSDRMETAWDRCVRDRGLVRSEMARRHVPPELRGDSVLVRAHARWVVAQENLARMLVRSGGAPLREREGVAEAERTYARELAAHHHLIPTADPTLAEVRARLASGDALVSFVEFSPHRDSTRLLALIARGGQPGVQSVDLGASLLVRRAVAQWRRALARSPGSLPGASREAERNARRLGEMVRRSVWDRLAPSIAGARDVYFVPDGPVLDLPWQALPTDRGRYLIEDGPRLHMLLAERDLLSNVDASKPQALLAMGSPDFGIVSSPAALEARMAAARTLQDPCADNAPGFSALPATLEEVRDVAAAWNGAGGRVTERVGTAATESAFKRESPGCTVLHLATHGIVLGDRCAEVIAGTRGVGGLSDLSGPRANSQVRPIRRDERTAAPSTVDPLLPPIPPSPWIGRRTWLALAGAQELPALASGSDDGRLTAEEIVTLNLSGTDWVVLSACHSGLGEGWSLEGSLGMRRAFALAGARAVIASEWAVEDRATREWMAHLHGARAQGAGTAEAMATASRAVLRERREQGRTTHPFYWAAFTASGD